MSAKSKFFILTCLVYLFSVSLSSQINRTLLEFGEYSTECRSAQPDSLAIQISKNLERDIPNADQSIKFKAYHRFQVSIGVGLIAICGLTNDVSKSMRSSGFNDTKWGITETEFNFIFHHEQTEEYSDKYPIREQEKIVADISVEFFLNANHGLIANYYGPSSRTIFGFQEFGISESHEWGISYSSDSRFNYGNFFNVHVLNSAFTLGYNYRFPNQRISLIIGPSIVPVHIKTTVGDDFNQIKWGVLTGFTGKIITKKWWFIDLMIRYRWSNQINLGPYEIIGLDPDENEIKSVFKEASINMNTLTIGFSAGFQF